MGRSGVKKFISDEEMEKRSPTKKFISDDEMNKISAAPAKKEDNGSVVGDVLTTIDSLTGAPVRSGLLNKIKGGSFTDPYSQVFGSMEDAAAAPTGKEIAKHIGYSDRPRKEESLKDVKLNFGEFDPALADAVSPSTALSTQRIAEETSPAGGVGLAIDFATDPSNIALPLAAKGAGSAAKAIGSGAKTMAAQKALKSAGLMTGDLTNIIRDSGVDRMTEMGQQLLNDKNVGWLSRPKDIGESLAKSMAEKEGKISGLIKKADELPELNMENATPDMIRQSLSSYSPKDIKKGVVEKFLGKNKGIPQEKLEPGIKEIDTWFAGRPETMSADELQDMKVGLNNFIRSSSYYKDTPGMAQEGLMGTRSGVRQAIEDRSNLAAGLLGEPLDEVRQTNRSLGNLYQIEDANEKAVARSIANREISLSDYIAGAAAAGIDPTATIPTMLANKGIRTYGDPVAANLLQLLSKTARPAGIAGQGLLLSPMAAQPVRRGLVGAEK